MEKKEIQKDLQKALKVHEQLKMLAQRNIGKIELLKKMLQEKEGKKTKKGKGRSK